MTVVFSWRHAIQKSSLDATTRLVLFNLSIYMNERGEGCFPSIATQAIDTGLTERSVGTHLKKAADSGFLHIAQFMLRGMQWRRHEYVAIFPSGVQLISKKDAEADEFQKGQEFDARQNPKREENDDKRVANHVPTNSPKNSPSKKHIHKKSKGMLIGEWEEQMGAVLSHHMMAGWIKTKKLCPVLVQEQIEIFRTRMTTKDTYLYTNFVAAFQNYLNSGYLPKALSVLSIETSPHNGPGYHEKTTRGVSI